MIRRTLPRLLACALLGGLWASASIASDWPTLHKDYQRSGYSEEVVQGPYERKWFRDFHDEVIASRTEAIIAEGKCFVGTFAGNLHALKVEDGSTAWTFKAAGPIGHSPCYDSGKVYFGSDDGFLYCLSAADGSLVWKYQAGAGIWVSPACDGKNVYFGDRAGVFHAVSVADGKGLWTFKTDNMILTPASFSADSKQIVFGSEDMHVYCLDSSGKLLWKSAKLGGLSLRDYAPAIWQGLVIIRTNPAIGYHQSAGENPAVVTEAQKALPMAPDDKIVFDKWGTYTLKLTPRRLAAEQEAVLKFLKANPAQRTFYALQLADGKEPWMAPALFTSGMHNPATPLTFNPKSGDCYSWVPSALSNYASGVPGGAITPGKLDRKTGLFDLLWHANGDTWGSAGSFAQPADETQALSLMGDILINTHQGLVGGLDLKTLRWHPIYQARDSYAGIFGPAYIPNAWQGEQQKAHRAGRLVVMANEWHGPARGVLSIADGRMFWLAGSQVVCLSGPDTPKTATGGTKPPEPPLKRKVLPLISGGNVIAGDMGGFDASIQKITFTPEQLKKYLAAPAASAGKRGEATALYGAMQEKLDAAVSELADGGPWAPFIVEIGTCGEEREFWRTAETMQILSLALPHLSPEVQAKARKHLDAMFASGAPLKAPFYPAKQGKRREAYDLSPQALDWAGLTPKYQATVEDLYALWAYAQYADRWDRVLGQTGALQAIFSDFVSRPVKFDNNDKDNDAAEHLNGQIAGTLAYARIMSKAGNTAEVDKAMTRLAELVTERIHHERADTNFVRSTKVAHWQLHQARLPRYLELAPEIAQLLRENAGEQLDHNVRGICNELPAWYQAFGERMIGGEDYTQTPTLARGLFMALADGVQAGPEELAAKLDQPWCKADLYYIEKLSAILRAMDRAQ